jgi:hypothetical protein
MLTGGGASLPETKGLLVKQTTSTDRHPEVKPLILDAIEKADPGSVTRLPLDREFYVDLDHNPIPVSGDSAGRSIDICPADNGKDAYLDFRKFS